MSDALTLDLQDWYEMMYELRAIENDPNNYRMTGVYYYE